MKINIFIWNKRKSKIGNWELLINYWCMRLHLHRMGLVMYKAARLGWQFAKMARNQVKLYISLTSNGSWFVTFLSQRFAYLGMVRHSLLVNWSHTKSKACLIWHKMCPIWHPCWDTPVLVNYQGCQDGLK